MSADAPPPRSPSIHRAPAHASLLALPAWLGLTLLAAATGLAAQDPPQTPPEDLRTLLAPGFLLADTNDDGFVDRIPARIRIAPGSGPAGVAAAANLSARLGFESYASDLELLESAEGPAPDHPLILVGTVESLVRGAGLDPGEALRGLAPGEGVLLRLPATDGLARGGIWIEGADATGLLAVAGYLSGRYPAIWDPGGPELDEWGRELEEALAEPSEDEDPENVSPPVPLHFDRLVVGEGRAGILRIRATARPETADETRRLNARIREEGDALLPEGLQRLELVVEAPDGTSTMHRLIPEREWSAPSVQAWQPRDVSDFTLSELYTLGGIYRDTRQDLVPDRTEAVLSLAGPEGAGGAVALANRIGLETAGIRLPFARVSGEEDRPDPDGFPILYGIDHYRTLRLMEADRLALPTGAPGEGFVELAVEALDGKNALVIGGTDEAGLEAAAELVAGRLPYLVTYEKGQYELAEMETELRRFFQARNVAGTTALALAKLEQWIDRIEAGDRPGIPPSDAPWPPEPDPDAPALERITVELALDTIPDGLEAHLTRWAEARLAGNLSGVAFDLSLHPTGFGAGEAVFDEQVALGWEVDAARERLEAELYSRLGTGESAAAPNPAVQVELRVSEPPEIREALATEILAELVARGADPDVSEVRVVNAYKQGFSWIQDHVLPRLEGSGVARIEIRYHHLQDSDELPWQVVGSETRWLQELFPVDAVLARDLGIPDSAVVFRASADDDPIYRLRALDAAGELLLEEDFTPRYDIRPYFGLHDDYERVRVATGWVRAEVDGDRVLDERVVTDMERLWDHWQGEIQPKLRDYLMDLHEGAITPASAPFFDELVIEARLSEPNHRIGIDEEVISSLESLHNDLYFTSLAFFSHLGNHYGVGSLNYPGRILPHIDPSGDGAPGEARFTLTGRSKSQPELVLRTRSADGEAGRWRYSLASPLPTEAPKLRGLSVHAGSDLPNERALVEVMARDSIDRWPEYRIRASEAAVDRSFLSVDLLEGMVEAVRGLHGSGVLEEALAFKGVGALAFRFRVEDDEGEADPDAEEPAGDEEAPEEAPTEEVGPTEDPDPAGVERREGFERLVVLPASANPTPTGRPVLRAADFDPGALEAGAFPLGQASIVQWETPMPPAESDSIMARLAAFPEVTVYHVGRSYLGRDMFAADFLPPVEGPYRSELKLTAMKPTLMLSGRQHANEVSSTSHLLRLGEILVRDPEYREMLRRVNVILHPITNADGAQLAWEMQRVNPDFTLHAGYLGALGVDVTTGSGSADPIYPEANVRPALMATWLPDIFINLHGYPSHEWVQHFSGYAAWVRGRTVTQRTWWAPRGWFIPGYTYVDDPDHPEIREAQFAILDALAASITGEPEVQAMSERQYERYRKYGRQDVDGFSEQFHEGMLTYLSLRGRSAQGSGPTSPRILTFSATTEAPDETARGEWLELVNTAGLAHTSALLRYLESGVPRVEREAEAFEGGAVARSLFRVRPVLPEEGDDDG
jgi:hypothetical protein